MRKHKPHSKPGRETVMPEGVDMPAAQIGAADDDEGGGGAFKDGGRINRGTATQREKLFKHRKNRSGC